MYHQSDGRRPPPGRWRCRVCSGIIYYWRWRLRSGQLVLVSVPDISRILTSGTLQLSHTRGDATPAPPFHTPAYQGDVTKFALPCSHGRHAALGCCCLYTVAGPHGSVTAWTQRPLHGPPSIPYGTDCVILTLQPAKCAAGVKGSWRRSDIGSSVTVAPCVASLSPTLPSAVSCNLQSFTSLCTLFPGAFLSCFLASSLLGVARVYSSDDPYSAPTVTLSASPAL